MKGVLACIAALGAFIPKAWAAEKWTGVDETVVGKFATQAGRPPSSIGPELSGDLPLLMFLLAGLAGGFVLGYYYHALFSRSGDGAKEKRDAV